MLNGLDVEVAVTTEAKHISVAVVLELVVNTILPLLDEGTTMPLTSAGELIVGLNKTAAKAPLDAVIELLVVRGVVATVKLVSIP